MTTIIAGVTGQFVQHHSAPPQPTQVFLKGKYAIDKNGNIVLNNPHLNSKEGYFFTDEEPAGHKEKIIKKDQREAAMLAAEQEYAERNNKLKLAQKKQIEQNLFDTKEEVKKGRKTNKGQRLLALDILNKITSVVELDILIERFDLPLPTGETLFALMTSTKENIIAKFPDSKVVKKEEITE